MGGHKIWRAQAKKMRRKRLRQRFAQERDKILRAEQERKEKSPRYQAWLSEQRALELFAEEEEALQSADRHAAWLAEEARAQKAWQERQEKLKLARAERAKQELRIREEWEEEQRKLKAAREEQERKALEKQQKQEELMRQIEDVINRGGAMPADVNIASATNPDRPPCPFFTKTGACRFGDRCSRNHARPGISRVLLVPNFYDHIGLRQINPEEPEGADDWLEYEDSETYHHFLEFFEDVLPEWERVGRVSQFKVCCNFEPHLKGNVYIEYENVCDAVKAFKLFHGRWYGGKQINVEFVKIDSWRAAICGQFHKHCCPKGRLCNFLHVFRNPGNAFHSADHDRQPWRRRPRDSVSPASDIHSRSWSRSPENGSRRRDKGWRWSASPSPPRVEDSRRSKPTRSSPSSRYSNSARSSHSIRKRSNEKNTRNRSISHDRMKRRKRIRDNDGESSRRQRSTEELNKSLKLNTNINIVNAASSADKAEWSSLPTDECKYQENNTCIGLTSPVNQLEELSAKSLSISSKPDSESKTEVSEVLKSTFTKEVIPDANLPIVTPRQLDRRKKKVKKKRERKSSHRKEKKRKKKKKKSQNRDDSSQSSESDSCSSGVD